MKISPSKTFAVPLYYTAIFIVALLVIIGVVISKPTYGATVGWQAGRIIDDSVFTNYTSMTASQIQSFLNSKVPTCDTNGTQNSEMNNSGVPDYNGNGSIQRWEWGKAKYNQTVFTCLKDYKQNNISAAQIIYNAAHTYLINPRVLIVLLQKEQGLVTDTWPLSIQYRSATGYGCPDNAACDSQYYGLTNQINWAAKMFRAIMSASPTWYTPYVLGNNYIQYNPTSSCGGSNVFIENRATQALYNYTPYQPNSNALNAQMGQTVPCGSYGNLNFYRYYTSWFGATRGSINQDWSLVSQEAYTDSSYTQRVSNSLNLEPGGTAYLRVKVKNTGNQVWDSLNMRLGTSHPNNRTSDFSDASWISSSRPAAINTKTVNPGEVATFEFSVTAPNALGLYKEYFRPLIEGYSWLRDIGLYYPITVASGTPYNSIDITEKSLFRDSAGTDKITGSSFTLYSGKRLYGRMKFKNVGNQTLTKSTFKLATTNPQNRSSIFQDITWLSSNRLASLAENSVAPGQMGTIYFTLLGPTATGTYDEAFGAVVEGVQWLDQDKLSLHINIQPQPPISLLPGQQLTTNQRLESDNSMYRLVLQNDGNLVLYSRTKALWQTRTTGKNAVQLTLQNDGNLVLYSNAGLAVWHTHTRSQTSTRLVLQNDGNLVLYSGTKALWCTHTTGM